MPGPDDRFAGCFALSDAEKEAAKLVFLGLPDDTRSSYRRGCAEAPDRIRDAYDGRSYNSTTELLVDLHRAVLDAGDARTGASFPETATHFTKAVREQLEGGRIPFLAGGDHAVTVPAVEAFRDGKPLHVIQIDAHPDLYPSFEGSTDSHACTGARLLEMSHVLTLTQIGVRTLTAEQIRLRERCRDRLTILEMRHVTPESLDEALAPLAGERVYVTLDLDGLDPAHAPGVSHPVPGGLTTRQVLSIVQEDRWELVGMDLVELNVEADVRDLTAIVAGRLLHEAMGACARRMGLRGGSG